MNPTLARAGFLVGAAIFFFGMNGGSVGLTQESADPEVVARPVGPGSIFNVGGTARKALPPPDCLRCVGPVPCAPCGMPAGDFRYFGSFPGDDDCFNRFNTCLQGDCAHFATRLTLGWIRLHENCLCPCRQPQIQRVHANSRLNDIP